MQTVQRQHDAVGVVIDPTQRLRHPPKDVAQRRRLASARQALGEHTDLWPRTGCHEIIGSRVPWRSAFRGGARPWRVRSCQRGHPAWRQQTGPRLSVGARAMPLAATLIARKRSISGRARPQSQEDLHLRARAAVRGRSSLCSARGRGRHDRVGDGGVRPQTGGELSAAQAIVHTAVGNPQNLGSRSQILASCLCPAPRYSGAAASSAWRSS